MARRTIRVTPVLLAALLTLSACGEGSSSGGGDGLPDTIQIAMVGDMTGFAAQYGKAYLEGAQIAVDEINESKLLGGSKLALEVEDTGSDPKTASAKVSAATRSEAVAILGPTLSNEAVVTAPLAQRAGVPYLSGESSTGTQEIGEWVYNMSPAQVLQAPLLAEFVSKDAKKVVIVHANDNPAMVDLKDALSAAFSEAGVEVVGQYGTPIAATDFTALVTKALGTGADAIGILGGGSMMPGIINQLRTYDYEGQIFGNMGADGSLDSSGPSSNGFIYPTQWVPAVDSSASKAFVEAYSERYPDSIPIFTTMDGYESVKFLALAIAEAQSVDKGAVLAGLQAVAEEGFESPSGLVTFTGEGKRQKVTPGIIVEYNDGNLVPQD